MTQRPVQVSLQAVRQQLETLKPYLSEQFASIPDSVKDAFKDYVSSLGLFRDSPDSYNVILRQVTEILGNPKVYPSGTLGQKVFGCIRYDGLPTDLVSCLPECADAVPTYSSASCMFPVWEEDPTTGRLIFSANNLGNGAPSPAKAIVTLRT